MDTVSRQNADVDGNDSVLPVIVRSCSGCLPAYMQDVLKGMPEPMYAYTESTCRVGSAGLCHCIAQMPMDDVA